MKFTRAIIIVIWSDFASLLVFRVICKPSYTRLENWETANDVLHFFPVVLTHSEQFFSPFPFIRAQFITQQRKHRQYPHIHVIHQVDRKSTQHHARRIRSRWQAERSRRHGVDQRESEAFSSWEMANSQEHWCRLIRLHGSVHGFSSEFIITWLKSQTELKVHPPQHKINYLGHSKFAIFDQRQRLARYNLAKCNLRCTCRLLQLPAHTHHPQAHRQVGPLLLDDVLCALYCSAISSTILHAHTCKLAGKLSFFVCDK